MKKNYIGFDVLRGLGIFLLIWMHSAFYYYDGLYELDFNNPPAVVTVIGLLLMFAGIFAVISGAVRTIQFYRKNEELGYTYKEILRYNSVAGVYILTVAYMYFVFTGPGLVNMEEHTMNNSILVELIRNGKLVFTNMERVLYVDSLVMLGLNVLIIGVVFYFIEKRNPGKNTWIYFFMGTIFFVISLVRIPLYDIYINALAEKRYAVVMLLNWFVNKNNPVFPYLSFGLMGVWIAAMLYRFREKAAGRIILPGFVYLATGVYMYIKLPDTMLERSIDLKWFGIMTAQIGLFLLIIVLFLYIYDFREKKSAGELLPASKFLYRFGVAGLTPFFLESVVSSVVFRVLNIFFPGLSFGLSGSLLFGFVLAISWGVFLNIWSRYEYRYGLEYYYTETLKKLGKSAKEEKLKGEAA